MARLTFDTVIKISLIRLLIAERKVYLVSAEIFFLLRDCNTNHRYFDQKAFFFKLLSEYTLYQKTNNMEKEV